MIQRIQQYTRNPPVTAHSANLEVYCAILTMLTVTKVTCVNDESITKTVEEGATVVVYCDGTTLGLKNNPHVREIYILKEDFGVIFRYNKYKPLIRVPQSGPWTFDAEGVEKPGDNSRDVRVTVHMRELRKLDSGIYFCRGIVNDPNKATTKTEVTDTVKILILRVESRNLFAYLMFVPMAVGLLLVLLLAVIVCWRCACGKGQQDGAEQLNEWDGLAITPHKASEATNASSLPADHQHRGSSSRTHSTDNDSNGVDKRSRTTRASNQSGHAKSLSTVSSTYYT